MKKLIHLTTLLLIFASCGVGDDKKQDNKILKDSLTLTRSQAARLSELPLKCIQREYPNKLGQVLNSSDELRSPKALHPAFYGCFDWHSAVHGQWLMVRLLKKFPDLSTRRKIRLALNQQLTKQNIATEISFFSTKYNDSFERTYGWAWLLKLQQELDSWDDPEAKRWSVILRPLSNLIVEKYMAYLPKLVYPIRTGEHVNTAFGLAFAYDYAQHTRNYEFQVLINERARQFYSRDLNYPLQYEPSGYDFLSPGLEEADLMRRVLTSIEFENWIEQFLPQLKNRRFKLAVGRVSDRTDGKLVHLDGLNFSRAWCLYGIAQADPRYEHLNVIADKHLSHSLPAIMDGDYMGEHWLASFAVYAMLERN